MGINKERTKRIMPIEKIIAVVLFALGCLTCLTACIFFIDNKKVFNFLIGTTLALNAMFITMLFIINL